MTTAIRVRARTLLLAGTCTLCGIQPAFGQREVTVEVSDCLRLEVPAERLACFERRVEEARGGDDAPSAPAAATPPPPAATPSPPAAQTRPVPQSAPTPAPAADGSFGRSTPRPSRREERAARQAQEAREGATPVREVVATIVTVRETVPNYRTITLDNGQIWRQTRAEFYPLQPGLEVRVYPANWGSSFRLTAPRLRGDIQVERVR